MACLVSETFFVGINSSRRCILRTGIKECGELLVLGTEERALILTSLILWLTLGKSLFYNSFLIHKMRNTFVMGISVRIR